MCVCVCVCVCVCMRTCACVCAALLMCCSTMDLLYVCICIDMRWWIILAHTVGMESCAVFSIMLLCYFEENFINKNRTMFNV